MSENLVDDGHRLGHPYDLVVQLFTSYNFREQTYEYKKGWYENRAHAGSLIRGMSNGGQDSGESKVWAHRSSGFSLDTKQCGREIRTRWIRTKASAAETGVTGWGRGMIPMRIGADERA